jgi:hypothetical protein
MSVTLRRGAFVLLAAGSLIGLSEQAESRSFRGMTPIAAPAQGTNAQDTGSAQAAARGAPARATRPVSRAVGEQALTQVVQAWNSGELEKTVSDQFYDKSRLLDAVDTEVPRNARVRLLSVQAVQTFSQRMDNDPRFGPVLVSRISATARTQVEFNDPGTGNLVNRPGVNEFIMVVRQRVAP